MAMYLTLLSSVSSIHNYLNETTFLSVQAQKIVCLSVCECVCAHTHASGHMCVNSHAWVGQEIFLGVITHVLSISVLKQGLSHLKLVNYLKVIISQKDLLTCSEPHQFTDCEAIVPSSSHPKVFRVELTSWHLRASLSLS